jgi:Family of unknown function (DUF6518)
LAGVALPAAVLFAEALVAALRDGDPAYRRDQIETAIIEVALGVVLVLVLGRAWRPRIGGLILSVPLALVGFVAFKVGGF